MSGIMRSVLAKFAVDVDVAPLTLMDRKINKLKESLAAVGTFAAASFAAAGYAAWNMVEAASAADEALNVLRKTFKGNSNEVLDWSRLVAREVGRSEFTLQESVGRFGAFLSPVFKDTNIDIAQMSKRLSELAVDLASFYNTSDEEAIMRLFSGISGETEAVRRLGINISDSALDELNKKKGSTKRQEALTLAEKTVLRFQKIMEDTQDKQGDAADTAMEWANSLKRVREMFKTFSVEMGRLLKKYALPLLHTFEKWGKGTAKVLKDLVERTHVFETALVACVGYAAALKLELIASSLAINGVIPKVLDFAYKLGLASLKAAALLAIFVGVEDVVTFLRGGDSIFGSWLSEVTQLEKPLDAVKMLFEGIAVSITNASNRLYRLLLDAKTMAKAAAGQLSTDDVRQELAQNERRTSAIDLAGVQRQRIEQQGDDWRNAVRVGGSALNEAANKFKRPGESFDSAVARVKSDRKALLATDPSVRPNADDVALGLAPKGSVAPSMSLGEIAVRAKSGPSVHAGPAEVSGVAAWRAGRGGKVIHIGEVNVMADSDERARGVVNEILRQAEAADGEEMSEEPE